MSDVRVSEAGGHTTRLCDSFRLGSRVSGNRVWEQTFASKSARLRGRPVLLEHGIGQAARPTIGASIITYTISGVPYCSYSIMAPKPCSDY